MNGEPAPSRGDEYLFYQALLGAWPAGFTGSPDREFVDRLRNYMQKAVKEKKVHTSWIHPSQEYDDAVSNFVERALAGRNSRSFLALFIPFTQQVARAGMVNSLSQLTLKIGSPGVPDFYQGSELWDLNLVDPDNRRPVDFRMREKRLEQMEPLLAGACDPAQRIQVMEEMLACWEDGRVKLYFTAAALRLRRRLPEIFVGGSYIPLTPAGPAADHLVAFARVAESKIVVTLAPRLVATLCGLNGPLPLGPTIWQDTVVPLPDDMGETSFRNIFTGETVPVVEASSGRAIRVADALAAVPAALLSNEPPEVHPS